MSLIFFRLGLIKIYRWLVERKGKSKVFLSTLEEKYPSESCLEERILGCQQFFWTSFITSSQIEVRPKVKNIRLCTHYLKNNERCTMDACGKLHLCPVNLLSPNFCTNPCRRRLSHNATTEHNKTVVLDAAPMRLQGQLSRQIPMLIKSSLPKLCEDIFNNGRCDKYFCRDLHMCLDHLKGRCIGKCKYSLTSGIHKQILHDFGRPNTREILESFGFNDRVTVHNKEILLYNILLPEWIHDEFDDNEILVTSKTENVVQSSILNTGEILGISNIDYGILQTPNNLPLPLDNNAPHLNQTKSLSSTKFKEYSDLHHTGKQTQRSTSATSISNVENLTATTSQHLHYQQKICDASQSNVENAKKLAHKIYLSMCEQKKSSVNLGNKPDENVIKYLSEELKNYFRLVQKGRTTFVFACPKDVIFCTNHWQKYKSCTSCSSYFGPKLHICPKIIFNDNGCFTSHCQMNHDIFSSEALSILKNAGLGGFDEDQLKFLLKLRFPGICNSFGGGGGKRQRRPICSPSTCTSFHVCINFLRGECRVEGDCNKGHEESLISEQAKRLMDEYQINVEKDFREYMRLVARSRKKSKYKKCYPTVVFFLLFQTLILLHVCFL